MSVTSLTVETAAEHACAQNQAECRACGASICLSCGDHICTEA